MATTTEELTEAQEAATDFANAVHLLSEAADALLTAGLTRRAIVILLRDATSGVVTRDIEEVLDALPRLAEAYTT